MFQNLFGSNKPDGEKPPAHVVGHHLEVTQPTLPISAKPAAHVVGHHIEVAQPTPVLHLPTTLSSLLPSAAKPAPKVVGHTVEAHTHQPAAPVTFSRAPKRSKRERETMNLVGEPIILSPSARKKPAARVVKHTVQAAPVTFRQATVEAPIVSRNPFHKPEAKVAARTFKPSR